MSILARGRMMRLVENDASCTRKGARQMTLRHDNNIEVK
jgi:hypothetical protein